MNSSALPYAADHQRATELLAQAWSVMEQNQTPDNRAKARTLAEQALTVLDELKIREKQ